MTKFTVKKKNPICNVGKFESAFLISVTATVSKVVAFHGIILQNYVV